MTRVQVENGRYTDGCVVFQVNGVNGFTGKKTSHKGQIDEFMVWSPKARKVYRVLVGSVGQNNVRLRVETPRGVPISTIQWAKDYEL